MLNLYKKGEIQIDYNASMNRLSMLKGNDWVSITPTALDIINVIAGSKSIFENVKINMSNLSEADVIRLENQILIQFSGRSLQSKVVFTCDQIHEITKKFREMTIDGNNKEELSTLANKKNSDPRKGNGLKRKQPTIRQGFDVCGGMMPPSDVTIEKRKKNLASTSVKE